MEWDTNNWMYGGKLTTNEILTIMNNDNKPPSRTKFSKQETTLSFGVASLGPPFRKYILFPRHCLHLAQHQVSSLKVLST